MPLELRPLVLRTMLHWAVHTDDLDNTDELADILEDVIVAFAIFERRRAKRNQAIFEAESLRDPDFLRRDAFIPHVSKAYEVMKNLLAASDDDFRTTCRLRKDVFKKLVYWLRTNTKIRNTRYPVELKVMVFLYIRGTGSSQRNAGLFFRVSQSSARRIFHEVQHEMVKLPQAYVVRLDRLGIRI
ncbi:hypothetical protein E4U09_006374 [Claviceps aff. purpurea]|uniref:DUF8040 domain-containing protein n=1 Tax=Claviceps aff. purpurea TaxID=1967640 RepID=A0A9P7U161_9HYPO|nr:hypothetical protein E4U09_006374 [Claviceps aff. purpurea]